MPRRDRYEAGRDLFLWVVKITTIAPPPLSPWKTSSLSTTKSYLSFPAFLFTR